MTATVRVEGKLIVVKSWRDVTCDDKEMQDRARSVLTDDEMMMGPWGSDPKPPLTLAERIADELGGEVLWYEPTAPIDPTVVY